MVFELLWLYILKILSKTRLIPKAILKMSNRVRTSKFGKIVYEDIKLNDIFTWWLFCRIWTYFFVLNTASLCVLIKRNLVIKWNVSTNTAKNTETSPNFLVNYHNITVKCHWICTPENWVKLYGILCGGNKVKEM